MAEFTAKDVKRLRHATGAGMMDAKKALTENDGDFEAAAKWLREKGLGKAAERADRENAEGAVAVARSGDVAAMVELKCETDFVAKSPDFVSLADELAQLVADKGEGRGGRARPTPSTTSRSRSRRTSSSAASSASRRRPATCSTPTSTCRATAASTASSSSSPAAPRSWPTTSPCTSPSASPTLPQPRRGARPPRSTPSGQTLEARARNEGKPEQALPKIVEGKLNGWFKEPGGAARAALRQGRQADGRPAGARRRQDRPLRPGRDRLLAGLDAR